MVYTRRRGKSVPFVNANPIETSSASKLNADDVPEFFINPNANGGLQLPLTDAQPSTPPLSGFPPNLKKPKHHTFSTVDDSRMKNQSCKKLKRDASDTAIHGESSSVLHQSGALSRALESKSDVVERCYIKTPIQKLEKKSRKGDLKVDLNHWELFEIDYSDLKDADELTLPWEKLQLLVKPFKAANDVIDPTKAIKNTNKLVKATDVIANNWTLGNCRSKRKREPNKRRSKEESASPGCGKVRKTDGTSASPPKKNPRQLLKSKSPLVSDLTPLKAQKVSSRKKPASSSQRKSSKRPKIDPVVAETHLSLSEELDRCQVPQCTERIWTPLDRLLSSPLGLLSMEQGGITVVEKTASANQFFLLPSALLEANPAVANAPPGSLLLVPSSNQIDDSGNQMVHVYRIANALRTDGKLIPE